MAGPRLGLRGWETPKFWLIPIVFAISVSLGIVILGISRGLDWTDEAWTVSLANTLRVSDTEPWAFQFLVSPLHALFGSEIVALRLLRLALYVGLGLVAAQVLLRIAAMRGWTLPRSSRVLVFALAQAGTVLAWSWPPRSFAYNELTAFLVQIVALLIALSVIGSDRTSEATLSPRVSVVLWSVIGLAVGLLLFTKFVAFFMLLPVAVLGALVSRPRTKTWALVAVTASAAVGIGVPWALGLPLPSYARSVVANLLDERIRAANVHSQDLVQMYIQDLGGTFILLMSPAMALLVSAALISGVWRESPWARGISVRVGLLLAIVPAVLAAVYVIQGANGAEKTGRLALVMLTAGTIVLLFLSWTTRSQETASPQPGVGASSAHRWRWRIWAGILLIASAPMIVSLGTNNPLTTHFGFGATVWATGFALGLALLAQSPIAIKRPSLRSWAMALGATAALLCLLVTLFEARTPYRTASFLDNNVTVTQPGPFSGLSVTQEENDLISWLHEQEQSLDAAETPTISLASPGALLAFNNSGFASSFIASWWPASFWTIRDACGAGVPNALIVLQNEGTPEGSADWDQLAATLSESCGLEFPGDFEAVANFPGELPQFDVTIWELR